MIRRLEHLSSCEERLRELVFFSLEKRRLQKDLTVAFQYLKGAYKQGGVFREEGSAQLINIWDRVLLSCPICFVLTGEEQRSCSSLASSMVDAFVKSKLGDNKVTLFVKGSCPYCRNAIALLKEFNFLPGCLEVVDITGMDDVQDYFQKTTGQRTVPRVFIGRTCIGGFSDLQKMQQQLPTMLHQIGALV